jgi:hypothetical protein
LAPLPAVPTQLVVAAAIFLAAKATEGPRRAVEVAACYFKTKNRSNEAELAMFNRAPVRPAARVCGLEDPSSPKILEPNPHPNRGFLLQDKYLPEIVDSIFTAERALLYTLSFQINVDLVIQQVFATLNDLTFKKDGNELSKEEFHRLQQVIRGFDFVHCTLHSLLV